MRTCLESLQCYIGKVLSRKFLHLIVVNLEELQNHSFLNRPLSFSRPLVRLPINSDYSASQRICVLLKQVFSFHIAH